MLQSVALFVPDDTLELLLEILQLVSFDTIEDAAVCCVNSYCLCAKATLECLAVKLYNKWDEDKRKRGESREIAPACKRHSELELCGKGLNFTYPIEFKVPSSHLRHGFELIGARDDLSLLRNAAEFYVKYLELKQEGFTIPVTKPVTGLEPRKEKIAYRLFIRQRRGTFALAS